MMQDSAMERDGPVLSPENPPARPGVTLHLGGLQELFSPPMFGEFGGSADVPSGIERLVAEMKTARHAGGQVTLVIPEAERDPDVHERLLIEIRRYTEIRIRELQHRRAALRREGMTSLLYSVPIVIALSLLSVLVARSGISQDWRTAIDGLFVVLEWVALWYPLDALFWYARPLTQELRALQRLQAGTVVVRSTT